MAPDEGATVSGFLDRLGRRAVRHRWWFIGAWIVRRGRSIVALAAGLDGQFSDNFRIPGAQSQEALDLLEQDFPSQAGDNALVVFQTPDGITSPAVETAIEESVTALGEDPPRHERDRPVRAVRRARSSRRTAQIAVVTVQFDTQAQNLAKDVFDQITAATAPADAGGRQTGVRGRGRRLRRPAARRATPTSSACSPRS